MHCTLGESGRETLVEDIEELESLDGSEIRARRLKAKEVHHVRSNLVPARLLHRHRRTHQVLLSSPATERCHEQAPCPSSSGTSSSSTSPPQGSSSTSFESSNRAKPRAGTGIPARFNKITQPKNKKVEQQAGNGRPSSRPSGKVRGVHRQSRGHTSGFARTRFS